LVCSTQPLTPKRDERARESHKDSFLPFSVYDSDVCIKCIGFALYLRTPDNHFEMNCNCPNKTTTMIELCYRDLKENGIEKD
jgi:hypothetical protein